MSLQKNLQNRLKKILTKIEQELLIDYLNLDIRIISHSFNFVRTDKTSVFAKFELYFLDDSAESLPGLPIAKHINKLNKIVKIRWELYENFIDLNDKHRGIKFSDYFPELTDELT